MVEKYPSYPWLFKGAYTIYNGTTKLKVLLGECEMIVTYRLEVTDIDDTNKKAKFHVRTTVIRQIGRRSKKLIDKEVSVWAGIGERAIISDEAILEGEYEGVLRVGGLGIRRCIVQQYSEGLNTTVVFWDREFNWPLQYLLILRDKTEVSSDRSIFDDVKDMFKAVSGIKYDLEDAVKDLKDALKESQSKALKEKSIILYLTETNIPELKL